MYSFETADNLKKKLAKLAKRNPKRVKIITKKIKQILKNPCHFKPLKGDMRRARRVHVDNSFVLVYEIDEKNKIVKLLDYGHHDKIY